LWDYGTVHSLLIAVDLPASYSEVAAAVDFARDAGWSVDLVYATAPEPGFVGYVEPEGSPLSTFRQAVRDQEEQQLSDLAEVFAKAEIDCRTHYLEGPIVETILACADETNARLIAIVGHKHNMAHRLILGSVTSTLLKASSRPVLVLPVEPRTNKDDDGMTSAVNRLVDVIDRSEKTVPEPATEQFVDLRGAAEAWLDDPDEGQDPEKVGVLASALRQFETDHPSLTRAVNDVAYYLSGLGI
jgi:nucleotide-binding universal stress UspA family protein/predicted transcriptional regulator